MKKELLTEVSLFFLCVVLVSFLWPSPLVLSLCLLLISSLALYVWHTTSDLLVYFAAFVLGPTGELVAVYFGAWQYSKPLYLVPIWLPLLWGIAAIFLKKIVETFTHTV